MADLTPEELADGLALWEEHKPQTAEDWVAVAERFIADGADTSQSSPIFAGLVLAVRQRDALAAANASMQAALKDATEGLL